MSFPVKGETIITVMVVVAVMVIGFITFAYIGDLSPDITPKYLREFSAGASPLTIDVDQSDLININITQWNVSQAKWEYVYDANWTYYESSGNIIITPMINETGGNVLVTAQYGVDMSDLWVKVASVIGFVIVIALLFYIFKALPKNQK